MWKRDGRWNRRGSGRLPLEERLCICGEEQTERHISEQCPKSLSLRLQHGVTTLENFVVEREDFDIQFAMLSIKY